MSQSSMATQGGTSETTAAETTTVAPEDGGERLLGVLQDADCRAVLDATSDEALSASEVSEACDLPLSTTYRKLDLLADVGALAERTRVCLSGKHTSEYRRLLEGVTVSVSESGAVEVELRRRTDPVVGPATA